MVYMHNLRHDIKDAELFLARPETNHATPQGQQFTADRDSAQNELNRFKAAWLAKLDVFIHKAQKAHREGSSKEKKKHKAAIAQLQLE